MSKPFRSFGSDNHAGIHPEVLAAIADANRDHCPAYGDDPWTQRATAELRRHFGDTCEVGFVFNGTGANVVGLASLARSYQAVICAETAHIQNDECGAPEKIGGTKLLTVPTSDGKLTPALVTKHLGGVGFVHHVQPKVISITQATELGTVYRPEEIRALADFAHARGLLLHLDGARLANAAASLSVSLRDLTTDAGVDVVSFGGTKNGLMLGEAVVFARPELAVDFAYLRKQSMQLASKMRFVSAQFLALFANDLYLRNARHANHMARLLADKVAKLPGVRLAYPVESNAVFVELPPAIVAPLQKQHCFYLWDEARSLARWMCAFDTTPADVEAFASDLERLLGKV